MKRFIPLVCLFFFVSFIPVQASEIDEIETSIENGSIEDISSCSKKLNDLYNDLYREEKEHRNRIHENEIRLNKIEKKIKVDEQVLSNEMKEISLQMVLYQINPKNDFDSQDFEETYEELNTLYTTKSSMKDTIDSLTGKIEELEKDMERIGYLQEKLASLFNKEEFRDEGIPNPYGQIQGMENIPAYGGGIESIDKAVISCLASGELYIDKTSEEWIYPIENGYISAGTWAYPSGDMHLGLDVACPLYSELKAPLNGIVLYADACTDSDNGYLGNWVGWPLGGGNTICMIGSYQDQLYAFSFFHLSNEILVYPGQQVHQGDVLAYTGNSGNSTGPHCHIEVFSLQCSLEEAIRYFIDTSDFTFQNGFDAPATCSSYACRIQPESIWG